MRLDVPIKPYGEPMMTVHNLNWVRYTNQAYGEPTTKDLTQACFLAWLSIFLCIVFIGEWTGLGTRTLGLHPERITNE